MTEQLTTLEISKEYLHFAAAHFTIFDAKHRENLHGHNFYVAAHITAVVGADGLTFDYNILKTKLKALCDELDEHVLMPGASEHIEIEQGVDHTFILFNGERIPFLARDLIVLPIRNITVEELSSYFVGKIRNALDFEALKIRALQVKCSSGEGQWADARWPDEPT